MVSTDRKIDVCTQTDEPFPEASSHTMSMKDPAHSLVIVSKKMFLPQVRSYIELVCTAVLLSALFVVHTC